MKKKLSQRENDFKLFLIAISLAALSSKLVAVVLSNYLKTVYHVTALQRGFIEFPRELPGVLTVFVIVLLANYSNVSIAIFAQILSIIGIGLLGLFKPTYGVMLFLVFVNSMGQHLTMPAVDSISISLSKKSEMGKNMGRYKGVYTAFTMVAGIIVFLGFKMGVFSFNRPFVGVYLLAATVGIGAIAIFIKLRRQVTSIVGEKKLRFVYRKEYKYYYGLVILYGLQKQIMLVFSPWVIISFFEKGPDTIAILTIIGSFIGTFFIPKLGVWIDKFGIKKLLFLDAWSFVIVYLAFGLTLTALNANLFHSTVLPLIIIYIIFILDKMSNQMGLIRTLYLKSISIDPADVTTTLSFGLALDHVISISAAISAGYIWTTFGASYIFFILAALSLINVYIAHKVE